MAVSGRWWWLAAALAVAAGVGFALRWAPRSIEVPAGPDAAAPGSAPASAVPAPPVQAAARADAPPPGLSAAQWQSLRRELAGRPAELQRVVDYLAYSDRLQRFRSLRGRASPTQLLPLAQALDAGLDERLARRELSAGEARLVKSAVLDVLQPDEAQRRAELARWEDARRAVAGPDRAAAARDAEFLRRQAAVVAAWQAQPVAQRDPRELERQLDELRRTSFDTPAR